MSSPTVAAEARSGGPALRTRLTADVSMSGGLTVSFRLFSSASIGVPKPFGYLNINITPARSFRAKIRHR